MPPPPQSIFSICRLELFKMEPASARVLGTWQVPVSAVGISAVAIITFLWTWNEFLFAMIFSNTRAVQPATVGAHYFVGDELTQWDSITATAMFTALPGLIFISIAQKAIVKGLTAGAVKG